MGRTLKRVPMDFDHPHNKVWPGYLAEGGNFRPCREPACYDQAQTGCEECEGEGRVFIPVDPPTGPGYQMWETTSEGSPQTPVFETLRDLAIYCAKSCTVFGDVRATADEWEERLGRDFFLVEFAPGWTAI